MVVFALYIGNEVAQDLYSHHGRLWLLVPVLLLSAKGAGLCCIAWSPNGAGFAYVTNDGFLSVRVVTAAGLRQLIG